MKKAIFNVLSALVVAAAMSACATTSGNASIIDDTKVSSIKQGKTSMKEVESLLGRPGSVELAESGEQVWTYQRLDTSAMAAIPFLNMMGQNGKESTLTIRFTKVGIVKAMARGETKL